MNRKRKAVLGCVGAIFLLAIGAFIYEHLTYVTTDDAQVGAHVILLSSRISGTIQKVFVGENQKIKAGEVLAQIDQSDYSSASNSAEAQLASLKARFFEAEVSYRRAADLFKKQAIPRERYDQALASFKELGARVRSQQAQLTQANLNVSYTRIIAPSDGIIAKKSVEPGQVVSAGQPIFGFVAGSERWVTANLKETQLENVQPGKKVTVEVDSIPGRKFEGEVESISPSTGAVFSLLPPDNATGNFTKVVQRVPVRIRFLVLNEEEIDLLRAGLSAVISIRVR